MRVVVAVLCAAVFVACVPTGGAGITSTEGFVPDGVPALDVALDIWAIEHDAARPQCAALAASAEFEVMDAHALADVCQLQTVGDAVACTLGYAPARIALDRELGQTPSTRVHELLHVLHGCHYHADNQPDGDGQHLDTIWEHLYDAGGLDELRASTG